MKNRLETPEEIQSQIYKELVRATCDRHHAWRTPALATTTYEGVPNARTVVLRKVQKDQESTVCDGFEIYTHGLSPKVSELQHQPRACLLFWSAKLSWQLRVMVDVSIHAEGPDVVSLWQTLKHSRAAGDYLGETAPGQPLSVGTDDLEPLPSLFDAPVCYFAVIRAKVMAMDWLELGRGQHRRARIRRLDDDGHRTLNAWTWLQP